MGKDVLSKIRSNDVYRALVRILDEYHVDGYEVVDRRPHPVFIISYCGVEKEFQFPCTPRPRVNTKRYASGLRRFLQDMQMEALELETRPKVPSKVGQVHVPMQGSLSLTPALRTVDGPVTMSSREIAELTGKRHPDVRRDIERMLSQLQEDVSKFAHIYVDSMNREQTEFRLDRDLTENLLLGYSAPLRRKVLARLRELEGIVAAMTAAPAVDLEDATCLRGLLLTYTEKVIALQDTVAAQQPKVEALERIAEADGSLCITDAAKNLQIKPCVLFKWMDTSGWTYTRPGGSTRLAYQTRLNSGYLEHKVTTQPRDSGNDRVYTQVRVTPKGLAYLAEVFPPIARVA